MCMVKGITRAAAPCGGDRDKEQRAQSRVLRPSQAQHNCSTPCACLSATPPTWLAEKLAFHASQCCTDGRLAMGVRQSNEMKCNRRLRRTRVGMVGPAAAAPLLCTECRGDRGWQQRCDVRVLGGSHVLKQLRENLSPPMCKPHSACGGAHAD